MKPKSGYRQGLGFAFRLGTELVVATGIGALMGFTVDAWLGTRPWFLALGIILGGAAGCLTVYRVATKDLGPPSDDDDSDDAPPNRSDDLLK